MTEIMFLSDELQQQFDDNGFVVLPMITPNEVQELAGLFNEIKPQNLQGIYSNVHDQTKEINQRVETTIYRIFGKHIDQIFKNCYMAGGTFLVKGTGPNSASTLHQDWNNVDETRFDSLNIWCPLVDVDEHNGALQVIKGSHRFFTTYRSMTIPTVYLDFTEKLQPYLTAVPVKAGQAVLYAHNLFHGSKPNYSNEVRVAVVSGILPKNSTQLHYYKNPSDSNSPIEAFEINHNFFNEGLKMFYDGKRPQTLKLINTITTGYRPLTSNDVFAKLKEVFPNISTKTPSYSLWQRIKSVFNPAGTTHV